MDIPLNRNLPKNTTTISRSDLPFALTYCGPIVSVNDRYVKKQVLSTVYRDSRDAITMMFRAQWKWEPIDYKVDVILAPALSSRRDTDNCEKVVYDAMQHAGVVKNDSLIKCHAVLRSDKPRGTEDTLVAMIFPSGFLSGKLLSPSEGIH
jgi:Holliday junction resolvase RusA-like endonuclease